MLYLANIGKFLKNAIDCIFFFNSTFFLFNMKIKMAEGKEITISDIAKQVNISASTVSRG
jgi:Helix-turn-helix domain of resolvase